MASSEYQSSTLKTDQYAKKISLINGFGNHSRSCLGKKLAEYEMYFLILTIIKIFDIKTVSQKFDPLDTSNREYYEVMDPRINNSSYHSIAIEQNWNSNIYFKKRSKINKKDCMQLILTSAENSNHIYDINLKAIKEDVTGQDKPKMRNLFLTNEID